MKSLQTPKFKLLFDIKNGESFYPPDYKKNDSRNIFLKKKLGDSYLFNPPYDQKIEDEEFKGLDKHIAHIRDLALKEGKIQVLILPLRKKEGWYNFLGNDVYSSLIILRNNLSFLRGTKKEIIGVANFQSILVFIGLNFQTTHVLNNTLGNFILENSFWHRKTLCYTQYDFSNNGKMFVENLKKTIEYVELYNRVLEKNLRALK